jgi:hypothetical protein
LSVAVGGPTPSRRRPFLVFARAAYDPGACDTPVVADEPDDVIAYARRQIAVEAGLHAGDGNRLLGHSLQELRDDALKLRAERGLPPLEPPQPRDEAGRYTGAGDDMNTLIRQRLGR